MIGGVPVVAAPFLMVTAAVLPLLPPISKGLTNSVQRSESCP